MKKKTTAKKSVTIKIDKPVKTDKPAPEAKADKPVAAASTRGRAQFAFIKAVKDVQTGIQAVVFEAVKKVKQGFVADIAAVAVTLGLTKVTSQDPVVQTHVHLNRLKHLKAVRRVTPTVRSSASAAPDASLAG